MTDEFARIAEQQAREAREARLVYNRILELYDNPLKGNFDAAHLKAVHAYIFQDLPEHQPGVVREDSDGWNKARDLEGQGPAHVVRYLAEGVEARISSVLQTFGGPEAIRGLSAPDAAARLAQLYGDLDHAHGFYEGNSRTLREFTRVLAGEAGYTLDWIKSGVGAAQRNALYIARDVAVLERAYPGLTEERAMTTDDRAQYEAWWHLEKLKAQQGEQSLEAIIRDGLSPVPQRESARQNEPGRVIEAPAMLASKKDAEAIAALAQEHARQCQALDQRNAADAERQALEKRQRDERRQLEILQARREAERTPENEKGP